MEATESAKYGVNILSQIPAPLPGRGIAQTAPETAFWVDGFRGYSDGFTFDTHYRWDTRRLAESDPDLWPDLTASVAEGDLVEVSVTADGRVRSNTAHGSQVLHLIGSAGRPGIAVASWWVPDLPADSLTIRFRHETAGQRGSFEISVDDWRSTVTAGVTSIE